VTDEAVRILIADDHPIVRNGLVQLLNSEPGLTVVAEADDGEKAIERIRSLQPAVAILDVDMPRKDGFAVARAVIDEQLAVEVIFLTMHKSESLLNSALDLGVKGYVLKDSAMADIINAVKAVTAKEEFISPALSKYLISRSRRASTLIEQQPSLNNLTPTERKVLALVAQGQSTKEIAETLFISPRTVDHHRANITEKLRLKGRNTLLRFALQHKNELL
jgi:DNA-binding NarL/FixJ family response regulator